MRTTHTYAILEISAGAYAEIRALLEAAGYQHAFHDDVIDMHGIAVKAKAGDAASVGSTMTRERAIEIARQAAEHAPTRPSYYTPPVDGAETFEPHDWVIGAIMNAAHFAVSERFDASELMSVVDAWIDLPSPGMVPNGYGDAVKRLVDTVDRLIDGTELLKQPVVQRRTEIATVKARIEWATKQIENANHHGVDASPFQVDLDAAREQALKLGVGS